MKHTPYEKACIKLTNEFIKKYFPDADMEDSYFVADDVTGVFYASDNFFTIRDMHEYMKYGYTLAEMFEHYYAHVEDDCKICIRDYLKLKKEGE